jgi:putative isomerase
VLEFEEPGHNSLLALESEMLGRIARELGREAEADELEAHARALAARISAELWDPERELFAGRHWDGRFATHVSPTSFFPLVAGAATAAQTEAMLHRYLLDEREFSGPLPLPSAPFSDPVGRDDSYWRGRIWPPHLFFCWEGLRRTGRADVAADLAARVWAMFDAEWSSKRHSHENFNSRDPDRHEAHDSDPFYSWGALIPFMAAAERADASPWSGITLGDGTAAPAALSLPGRQYATATEADRMVISVDGNELLALTPPRRIARLTVSDERIAFTIEGAPCRLELSAPRAQRLQALTAAGAPATPGSDPTSFDAVGGEVVAQFAPALPNGSEQRPTTTEEQTL